MIFYQTALTHKLGYSENGLLVHQNQSPKTFKFSATAASGWRMRTPSRM